MAVQSTSKTPTQIHYGQLQGTNMVHGVDILLGKYCATNIQNYLGTLHDVQPTSLDCERVH